MKKQDKIELVKSLGSTLSSSASVVMVNFEGLSVSLQQKLKKELKAVDADMVVVKNTLIKRAGTDAGIDESVLTDEVLSGQTALILTSSDPVAPIQVLGKFIKENQVPRFKVGVVEGNFQDSATLEKLSTLLGKDALLGLVLGSLMAPMTGLIGTLSGNMQKLLYLLQNANPDKSDTPDKSEKTDGQIV